MGNTNSTVETAKDTLLGTTTFLLARSLNPHVVFGDGENDLPLPSDGGSDNIYETAIGYYGQNAENDARIEEYINEHILNSKENTARFYKSIVDALLAVSQHKTVEQILSQKKSNIKFKVSEKEPPELVNGEELDMDEVEEN
jgi:hypothetical protein